MTTQSVGLKALLRRLLGLFSDRQRLTEPDARQKQSRSIFIRHVDAGSCNDCELEITALSNPLYDVERFGLQVVASPRHADVLLVSGPLTRSMRSATLAAFRAMPESRRVVTLGDGFCPTGSFYDSYAVVPLPDEMTPAWVMHIPGNPPSPRQILEALLTLETS
jgi:Ni,Fe-hydrogenase III small subunit